MLILVMTRNEDLLKAKTINDRFGKSDPWVQFRSPDQPQVKGLQPDAMIIDYDTCPEYKGQEQMVHNCCSNMINLATDEGLGLLRKKMIEDYKAAEVKFKHEYQNMLNSWEDSFRRGYPLK